MTSEEDDRASAPSYELVCTDCPFETTVEGPFLGALDVAEDHQEDNGRQPSDHFVNVELNGHRFQEGQDE